MPLVLAVLGLHTIHQVQVFFILAAEEAGQIAEPLLALEELEEVELVEPVQFWQQVDLLIVVEAAVEVALCLELAMRLATEAQESSLYDTCSTKMAHFAEIDQDNKVLRVVVVANADTADVNGNEVEQIGKDFCNRLLGGNWVQTSYNANFRGKYAGMGDTYDPVADVFVSPPAETEEPIE